VGQKVQKRRREKAEKNSLCRMIVIILTQTWSWSGMPGMQGSVQPLAGRKGAGRRNAGPASVSKKVKRKEKTESKTKVRNNQCKKECKNKNMSPFEKEKCRSCRKKSKNKIKNVKSREKSSKNGKNNPCKKECKNKKKSQSEKEECRACRKKHQLKNERKALTIKTGKRKVLKKTTKNNQIEKSGKNNMEDKAKCLSNAVMITKFMKDNVINFLRRKERMDRQRVLLAKKLNKQGDFAQAAVRIIEAGGGNKSTLTCTGSQTNEGAGNMLTVANTLTACKKDIIDACTLETNNETDAFLDKCVTKAKAFNQTVQTCIEKAKDGKGDACDCYSDPDLMTTQEELRECKGTTEARTTARKRDSCMKVVKDCKDSSIQAGVLQYACALTMDEMLKTLKTLTANEAAVSSMMANVASLTGASNPNSRRIRRNTGYKRGLRHSRQALECSSVSSSVAACTTLISESPGSSTIVSVCTVSTTTTVTCTPAEVTALETSLTALEEQRQVLVITILSVQIQILEVSGATASPAEIDAAGTGTESTVRMMKRSLEILRQKLREKLSKKKN
jgi:hypothetical protein